MASEYEIHRLNMQFCPVARIKGALACFECEKLNPEKYRLCHQYPWPQVVDILEGQKTKRQAIRESRR